MKKYRIPIICAIVVVVIAIIMAIAFNRGTNNDQLLENNDIEEEVSYTPVIKDTISDKTANLNDIKSQVDNRYDNLESLNKLSIISDDDENIHITRFQLAYLLYEIMLKDNKLPINIVNMTFEDWSSIPDYYKQAVTSTVSAGILTYQTKFDGYKYVLKDEVDLAFSKLNTYLDNWVESSNNDDTSDNLDNTTSTVDKEAIENELNSREDLNDTLNGQSVAQFDNPKTLEELQSNLNSISKVDLYDSKIQNMYRGTNKVNYEYITLGQGLADWSKLDNLTVDEDPDYLLDDIDIIGLTVAEPASFSISDNLDQKTISLRNSELLSNYTSLNTVSITKIVGIYNYKIVSYGTWYSEVDNDVIILDKTPLDAIGILVPKDILENTYKLNYNEDSTKYVILEIPLEHTYTT